MSSKNPPKLANWLLSKMVGEELQEEFLGDLQEIYEERLSAKSKVFARCMYWVDALHLLFGFTSFKIFKTQNNNTMMLKSMFIIAWRNAIRQKQFTLLNIVGLTIGISISLIIGLYVYHEKNYDNFLDQTNNIYRVNQPNIWGDWTEMSSTTGPNVADALREEVPEFREVTRILNQGSQFTSYKTKSGQVLSFKEDQLFWAEKNFFKVFDYEMLLGNQETALEAANSMVLTETAAQRYFGLDEALGQTIQMREWDGSSKSYVVTGVLKDLPTQSHLQFDVLTSLTSAKEQMDMHGWKWIWTAFSTYVLVDDGADVALINDKLQAIPPKYAPPTTKRIFNQSFEEFTAGNPWKLDLQALPDIYLSSDPPFNSFGPIGNKQFVQVFMAIGLVVLTLSCINFMNLSTAKSSSRAKEVGVRKVLGSLRNSLIRQFVFESVLFVSVSTILALVIVSASLDWFNLLAQKELTLEPVLMNPVVWLVLIGFVLTLGLLSGGYPAFYLSSFKPIEVIKGKISKGQQGKTLRNGLVVFQFSISICLIICSLFVQKQLSYTSKIDLGLSDENVLQIHNIEQFGFNTEVIKSKLEGIAAVTLVGKSFGVPPNVMTGDRYRSTEPDAQVFQLNNLRVDDDYLNVLDIEFLAGRNFEFERPTDQYSVILNQAAVELLGWTTEEAVGKHVAVASGNEDEFEVIGVAKDFNYHTTRQAIGPLILISDKNDKVWDYGAGLSFLSMKLNPQSIQTSSDLKRVLDQAESALNEVDASIPFEYSFMDQAFEDNFRTEQRMATVLNFFTLMAMIIACLGLFGLAAFSAEQRTKELSIRKVLGANTGQLTYLFSTGFVKLVIVSILISAPLAYWLVSLWLEGFAYRTPMQLGVFVLASLISLIVAILTTGYQSLYVASRNPVDTLKGE